MVDKNLFLYDLAVVAIMKDEERYVKEWLDYYLLAGADHFYIYDNDSKPEFKKVLQPYIDADIVTYILFPGRARLMDCYNDAFERFKFECRYMPIMDGDEFIFPKTKSTITEFVDEILSANPQAGGLVANWQLFGSNGHDKADYSKGVLDRFTRRAPKNWTGEENQELPSENARTKVIINPRRVAYFDDPHNARYFLGFYSVNEQGNYSVYKNLFPSINYPVTADKIALNHYFMKSYEEYTLKRNRGDVNAFKNNNRYNDNVFKRRDRNEEFDDGIIKYRDARKAALIPTGGG